MQPVYLDWNATTPLDPRVREAMLPWLGERHGNPSSAHGFGQAAREAVEAAREKVAGLVGMSPPEIVFAATGSEANNAVILGAARRAGFRGRLVISAIEHPSVLRAADVVEAAGVEVVRVEPGRDGRIDPRRMLEAVGDGTLLVCLMLANNEIGTLQPVAEVAAGCRERGVPLLTDAVQAVGKVPVDAGELATDYLVLGAHKFYGPLGAAAVAVRGGSPFEPLIVGGGQERRRRAGTENVAAIVGLGEAAALAAREMGERVRRLGELRDRLERGLAAAHPEVVVHGAGAPRLPNTSHFALPGIDAEALAIRLDLAGFAVSTGSACHSGAVEPSAVLTAMGVPRDEALGSLRVSVGPANTDAEIDRFLEVLAAQVAELARRASAATR